MSFDSVVSVDRAETERSFLRETFAWMFLALAVTCGVAIYLNATSGPMDYFEAHPGVMWALFAVQIGMVIAIPFVAQRASTPVVATLFAVYAAAVGVTFSVILGVYTTGSIVGAFAGAAGVFAGMAAWGYTTSSDLTRFGPILFGVLVGFFFAAIAFVFIGGSVFNLILGIVGVLLFSALTAYDMQRLKQQAAQASALPEDARQRLSILGALSLYLDFINLFLSLLRIFGAGRG
jgi:uncharacterized protein